MVFGQSCQDQLDQLCSMLTQEAWIDGGHGVTVISATQACDINCVCNMHATPDSATALGSVLRQSAMRCLGLAASCSTPSAMIC